MISALCTEQQMPPLFLSLSDVSLPGMPQNVIFLSSCRMSSGITHLCYVKQFPLLVAFRTLS